MATEPALTPRELDVMRLVAGDHTSKQIGRILVISPRTVETHVRSSLRKLGCATRAGAVWRLASGGVLAAVPCPPPSAGDIAPREAGAGLPAGEVRPA